MSSLATFGRFITFVGLWTSGRVCLGNDRPRNYTCNHGGITHHGHQSESKPRISMNCPGTFTKLVDQHVEIICEVIANPAARIHWQRDGRDLKSSSLHRIDRLSCNQRVQLYPVLPHHKGTYTCIASNLYGTDKKSCRLDVRETTVQLINIGIVLSGSSSISERAILGSQLNMTCTVFNARTIYWLKNGRLFIPTKRVSTRHSSTIIFDKIAHNDTGNYTCIGSKRRIKRLSYKMLLIEKVPFKKSKMRSRAVILLPEALTLMCWVLTLLSQRTCINYP